MLKLTHYKMHDGVRAFVHFLKDYYRGRAVSGIEIGVFKGENAKAILDNINHLSVLHLIDPYDSIENAAAIQQQSHALLSPYPNVKWIYKKSKDAVLDLPNRVSFAYIDELHGYGDVMDDVSLYYPLVETYGILGGHDFIRAGNRTGMEVNAAICEIAAKTGVDIYISDDPYAEWWMVKPYDLDTLNVWI